MKDHPRAKLTAFGLPALLAACSMLGPFSIDTVYPAYQQVGRDFAQDSASLQLIVSAYLVTFGAMSIVHGPISDSLGRKPVMIAGIAIYVLASAGCALAWSFPVLIAMRCLQGFSAGAGVILSRTLVRDLYEGAQAQRLMATVMMIFGLAPAIAPLAGGWLLKLGPWPIIFWFLVGYGALLVICIATLLPETLPREQRVPFKPAPLFGEVRKVLANGSFQPLAWIGVLSFSSWFIYVASASIIVFDIFGKGPDDFWQVFFPVIAGVTTGSWISARAAGRISRDRLIDAGLWVLLLGAIVNVAAATLFGDTAWTLLGATVIAMGGAMSLPGLQLAMFDAFPDARGAVASVFTFQQMVFSAVMAAFLIPLVDGSLATLALTGAVFAVTCNIMWLGYRRRAQPTPIP